MNRFRSFVYVYQERLDEIGFVMHYSVTMLCMKSFTQARLYNMLRL